MKNYSRYPFLIVLSFLLLNPACVQGQGSVSLIMAPILAAVHRTSQPPPLPPVSIFHKTDFLTAGCFTHVIPGMSIGKRETCINNIKSRGYSHFYVYAYNEYDYGTGSFNYYNNPEGFKAILSEIRVAGLWPVVWLFPDDAPIMAGRSTQQIKGMLDKFVPEIDDFVGSYVLGLELDEYWGEDKVDDLGRHLAGLTDKKVGVHQTPGRWDYCSYSWCDYMVLQYGFGKSEDEIKSMTKQAISALGKPVVAGEYSSNTPEIVSIALGNAAVSVGSSGFGNGGTP